MLSILTWSMNRAPQLLLSLDTLKRQFKEFREEDITIIYKYTSQDFMTGYEIVKKLYPNISWILEADFRTDTLKVINDSKNKLISFFVDDDVFLRKFSVHDKEFEQFINEPEIACLALRLAPYITSCYPYNSHPESYPGTPKYLWRQAILDFQYPYSVACLSIYRKEDILYHINGMAFRNPNSFEAGLCNYSYPGKDFMLMYTDGARSYCSSENRVQQYNDNRHENRNDVSEMNSLFLSGKRLASDIYDNRIFTSCHGPLDFIWK